jgi:hypothetical protein
MVLENRDKEADDLAKNNAKAKKAKASDRFHDLFLLLLGSLITVLIDHFGDIVLWFEKAFK